MLGIALILALLTAGACLALNQIVASRWLGMAAAASLLLAALALLVARAGGLPVVLLDISWIMLGEQTIELRLHFDAVSWPFALLALLGGSLALAALALALPRQLRGFGGLLAALLLAPLATTTGVASLDPLLLPFPWMVATLSSFVALRASGALGGSDAPLLVLTAGAGGAILAFAAAILQLNAAPGTVSVAAVVAASALALLALGAPPLHAPVAAATAAPAALAAVVVALGTPLLGGYALVDYAAALGPLAPPAWSAAMIALGTLTLLVSAAGAAGTTRMRQIAGWQFSAQAGTLLIAAGLGGAALTAAAPALLANAALTTLAALLAIATLERRTGSDDLTALGPRGPFRVPGMAMLIAAASACGFPGTLGFWSRLWLTEELARVAPWALALLLAGSALLALTYLAPVAAFWRRDPAAVDAPRPLRLADLPAALAALPLLLAGAAPAALWGWWLADAGQTLLPNAPAQPPILPSTLGVVLSILAAVALVAGPLLARRGSPRGPAPDPEMHAEGIMPPAALGQSLASATWVGRPPSLAGLWELSMRAAGLVGNLLALFERRYYLAGLLLAMIVVILIFI